MPVLLLCRQPGSQRLRFVATLLVGTAVTFPTFAYADSTPSLLVGQGGNGGAGAAVSSGTGGAGGGGGGGLGGGGAGGQGNNNNSGGGGGFLGGLKGETGTIGGAGQIVGGGGGGGGTSATASNGGAGGSAGSGAGGSGTPVTGTASNTGANGAGGAGGPGGGSGGGGGGGIGGGGGGGNGGTGGYGAGQGTNAGVGGYSQQSGSPHSQNAFGTGGNAIASDLTVITSPTYQINNAQTYEYVGVGGGGGGGGARCDMSNPECSYPTNYQGTNGNDGSNNAVAVGTGGSLSATSILLGGGGGGGNGGYGGNGGNGVLNVAGGSVTTSQDLQIGAGGGASGGGGIGGNGTLAVSGGVVSVGRNLQVGGDGGMDTSGGLGGPGQGGQGTMSVTGGTVTVGQALYIGGNGGAGGAGPGGFGGNGTLNINGTTAVLFVKTITLGGSGGPAVRQNFILNLYGVGGNGGNGTLEVANGGTLVLGNGSVVQTGDQAYQVIAGQSNGTGTFGISGTANIEVDSGNTATIDVPVSGTGVLTKDGAGTLIQAVASTYTGGTTINGGVLQIGSASSSVNYNETTSGPLTVSITPEDSTANTAPLQVANGSAAIGGTLTVNVNPGQSGAQYSALNTYRIVTATQGVTGRFTSLTLGGAYAPYLLATTLYKTDEADLALRVAPKTYESGHVRAASSYGQNMALFDVLSFPMQADAGYWMHGVGSFGHAPGVSGNYKGFLAGRGFTISPHLIVGGAISNIYSHSNGADGSFVDGTSFGAEAYGLYSLADWRFTGILGVGHLGNRSTRYMPGVGEAQAASNGLYEGASLRANYALINRTHLFLSPYAEAKYLHTTMGHAQETGTTGLNMGYGKFSTDQARLGGGVVGGYRTITSHGVFTAWAGLGGLGTLGNTHVKTSETVMDETQTQSAQISYIGAFTPSVGVMLAGRNQPWKLAANWQGQLASRFAAQSFTLEGSYKF